MVQSQHVRWLVGHDFSKILEHCMLKILEYTVEGKMEQKETPYYKIGNEIFVFDI